LYDTSRDKMERRERKQTEIIKIRREEKEDEQNYE
jgi:hypothetical protein